MNNSSFFNYGLGFLIGSIINIFIHEKLTNVIVGFLIASAALLTIQFILNVKTTKNTK